MNYCCNALTESNNEDLKNVVRAFYLYTEAAKGYFLQVVWGEYKPQKTASKSERTKYNFYILERSLPIFHNEQAPTISWVFTNYIGSTEKLFHERVV